MPLEQCCTTEGNLPSDHGPGNAGKVLPPLALGSYWLLRLWEALTFLWRSAPSSFLSPPGPPRLQESRKFKRGKGNNSRVLNQFQGWMCPASKRARPGKQGPSLHNRPITTRPRGCDPVSPTLVPSSRPANGQPLPPDNKGGGLDKRRRGLLASFSQCLFCLSNSSAVSEYEADPDRSPRTPFQK